MGEIEIQSEILGWLKRHGVWHVRIPNGGVRHAGIRKKNPLAGLPDIMGVLPGTEGRLFMIEVKSKDGKLSETQAEVISDLRHEGVLVIVARQLSDVQEELLKFELAI